MGQVWHSSLRPHHHLCECHWSYSVLLLCSCFLLFDWRERLDWKANHVLFDSCLWIFICTQTRADSVVYSRTFVLQCHAVDDGCSTWLVIVWLKPSTTLLQSVSNGFTSTSSRTCHCKTKAASTAYYCQLISKLYLVGHLRPFFSGWIHILSQLYCCHHWIGSNCCSTLVGPIRCCQRLQNEPSGRLFKTCNNNNNSSSNINNNDDDDDDIDIMQTRTLL